MIRRPPRSTLDRSSAASDVYKRQSVDALEESSRVASYLTLASEKNASVKVLNFNDLVCPDEVCFAMTVEGGVVFRDSQHLTDSFAAVSYTHLRAHETVLDLVCRLLLEKKKYIY